MFTDTSNKVYVVTVKTTLDSRIVGIYSHPSYAQKAIDDIKNDSKYRVIDITYEPHELDQTIMPKEMSKK